MNETKNKRQKQQSPSWERYERVTEEIEGFPFNEGFPQGGPFGNYNKTYELVLRSAERCRAYVDYSTQYRAEGIRWRTLTATGTTRVGASLERSVVAAWKER